MLSEVELLGEFGGGGFGTVVGSSRAGGAGTPGSFVRSVGAAVPSFIGLVGTDAAGTGSGLLSVKVTGAIS